jgi:hypothetical protein
LEEGQVNIKNQKVITINIRIQIDLCFRDSNYKHLLDLMRYADD